MCYRHKYQGTYSRIPFRQLSSFSPMDYINSIFSNVFLGSDKVLYTVAFSRSCSRTHSALKLISRTITGWFSCKNVSTTQNSNWEQPCAFCFFLFFKQHLTTKDLHVLRNFPTKAHIPTLKPPAAFHFHTLHVFFNGLYVIQSLLVTWCRQMRVLCFVLNKWKAARFCNSPLNAFQTLLRTLMPTSRRSPRRSWTTEPTYALTL